MKEPVETDKSRNKFSKLLRMCWRYDVTTAAGRRIQSLKIIGVALIAIVGLLFFVIEDVIHASKHIQQTNKLEENLDSSLMVASLIHRLQIERGLTALCLGSSDTSDKAGVYQKLKNARVETDKSIKDTDWPFDDNFEAEFLREVQSFRTYLNENRYDIGKCHGGRSEIQNQINFYTHPINLMLDWFYQTVRDNAQNSIYLDLIGYHRFLAGKDKIGIERALGGTFFAMGYFRNSSQLIYYANHSMVGQDHLEVSGKLMPEIKNIIKQKVNNTVLIEVDKQREIIRHNSPNNESVNKGEQWFDLMTLYLNDLFDVQEEVGATLRARLEKEKQGSKSNLAKRLSLLVISLLMMPILVLSVNRMLGTIQNYTFQLAQTTLELKEEKTRADTLLYQMFPHPVAELLKNNQQIPAEFFNSVTIFFSDIVNFTEMCSSMAPLQVTAMLDTVYGVFDDRISRYDVYKVETIGDAYMVVSGLPRRNGMRHADQIARMALDLLGVVNGLNLPEFSKQLSVRIGIHTGPCVAGVVGNKMPRYCLFGDTVNTASRMQTTGEPQNIQITENTKDALDEIGGYDTVFRCNMEVKGKGYMSTYWLKGFDSEHFRGVNIGPGEVPVSAFVQM